MPERFAGGLSRPSAIAMVRLFVSPGAPEKAMFSVPSALMVAVPASVAALPAVKVTAGAASAGL